MTTQRKSPLPVPITLSKGSIHITASRAFIDYVLHDDRALQFRKWIKDTGVPDETFFSSLNHSPQMEVPGAYKGAVTKKKLIVAIKHVQTCNFVDYDSNFAQKSHILTRIEY
jgi:hypothetical protein